MNSLRRRMASWKLIGASGVAYLVSQAAIARTVRDLAADMLRVQTSLSAANVRAIFARWEAAGLLSQYAAHFRYDMVHPLWYATLLGALMAKGYDANDVPDSRNAWLLLPFAAGLCDCVENLAHLRFLADRANITPSAVIVGNGAALVKWALAAASIAAVFGLAAGAVRRGRNSGAK